MSPELSPSLGSRSRIPVPGSRSRIPVRVLASLAKLAAEADGVEEAAVAQGLRVTAAKLGGAALGQLGAAARRDVSVHFDRRRRRLLRGDGALFGLLEGKRAESGCSVFTRTSE